MLLMMKKVSFMVDYHIKQFFKRYTRISGSRGCNELFVCGTKTPSAIKEKIRVARWST